MSVQRLLVIFGAVVLNRAPAFVPEKDIDRHHHRGRGAEQGRRHAQRHQREPRLRPDLFHLIGTAAVAASFISPIFVISPAMGAIIGMKAFIIVILGGMGSIPGAIIGGYFLGLIESLGGGYISAAYKDVFAFGALIVIFSIKPTGLFGKKEG
jgi:hypothetical protein